MMERSLASTVARALSRNDIAASFFSAPDIQFRVERALLPRCSSPIAQA